MNTCLMLDARNVAAVKNSEFPRLFIYAWLLFMEKVDLFVAGILRDVFCPVFGVLVIQRGS